MKKTILLIIALSVLINNATAQTWSAVKNDKINYLTGEGRGETIDEADQQALAALISQLSVEVSSNLEMLEGETTKGDNSEYQKYVTNKISTFSNATLTNTEYQIISNEPDAHVVRWIRRSEIEKIFQGRKDKVFEYLTSAQKGEQKGKVDDALRNYYWAYTLLKTLQHPSSIKFEDNEGVSHTVVSWIPEKMNEIFEAIKVSVISKDGDDLDLFFTFNGKPITSLDYTYFDGGRWSNLYSAKDGKGVLELAPGAITENIQLKIEFAYKNEAHIDKEISSVINVVKGASFRKSYITIDGKVDHKAAKSAEIADMNTNRITVSNVSKAANEGDIRASMNKVIDAIRKKSYNNIAHLFTPDGLDMYNRLISYGNAQILGDPQYAVYKNGNYTVVRSIPMSFYFSRGTKKSFVEDIVFTFDSYGKIESLAFALDDAATKDVLTKQAWPEHARMAIIEFLENYKTAFALERLDYIRTIFDDNAVIIVGKLVKVKTAPNSEHQISYNNHIIERTRYTKEQYLRNLERCFASNEFVNIRFANNDIIKAGVGGEIYGIQIKQDYYSTNYGDTGYLFLLVDINNPKEPSIKVRTWQPEPDPMDGIIGIEDF